MHYALRKSAFPEKVMQENGQQVTNEAIEGRPSAAIKALGDVLC